MPSNKKYWKIECHKHLSILYEAKIKSTLISEKKLVEFIRILLSKYALSDDEILEQCIQKSFKPKKNYINIIRKTSNLNEPLNINFTAQIADISVYAFLTD